MTIFLFGFLASSCLWMALILAYYIRARRRVDSIRSSIERYRISEKLVGQAIDKVYEPKNQTPKS